VSILRSKCAVTRFDLKSGFRHDEAAQPELWFKAARLCRGPHPRGTKQEEAKANDLEAARVLPPTGNFHPLVVLVVPALGGLLGGIVGLILAVIASKPSLACDREAPWRGSPNAPSRPCDASSAEVDHSITLPITLAHSWTARDFGSFGPSTRVRSDSRTS
jgi:hypothetical protein